MMRAQAIGVPVEHLLLEHVFHFAARATAALIKTGGRETLPVFIFGPVSLVMFDAVHT